MKNGFTMAEVLITIGIIGLVAAMTFPSIVGKYQKKVAVERLKKVYNVISQAVTMSINDYDDVEYWDFELSAQEFMDTYLSPHFQKLVIEDPLEPRYSKTYILPDGTKFYGWMFKNPHPEYHDITTYYQITVDINGNQNPNRLGRDTFVYYIFPKKSIVYNTGLGNCAKNIKKAGIYPAGYGYTREQLKNDSWMGCNKNPEDGPPEGGQSNPIHAGAFCTALIMLDGWKIADDYKW